MDQRSSFRLFCVHADKHKIRAVAVETVGLGTGRSVFAGILLMTTIELPFVTFLSLL
jgi:hypothetical protein